MPEESSHRGSAGGVKINYIGKQCDHKKFHSEKRGGKIVKKFREKKK